MNDVLKEYNEMKKKIKNKKFKELIHPLGLARQKFIDDFSIFINQCDCIIWSVEKIIKMQEQKTEE